MIVKMRVRMKLVREEYDMAGKRLHHRGFLWSWRFLSPTVHLDLVHSKFDSRDSLHFLGLFDRASLIRSCSMVTRLMDVPAVRYTETVSSASTERYLFCTGKARIQCCTCDHLEIHNRTPYLQILLRLGDILISVFSSCAMVSGH